MPLFHRARDLMRDGRYAEACPLLEESQRLDPGVGTEFNLARCYELTGRLASAWRTYEDVARATHATGQTARESIARERMNELTPRLAHVVVDIGEARGLDVAIDGAHLAGTEELDRTVDVGSHEVIAAAPGKRPWRTSVSVARDGERSVVHVPTLEDAPPPPRSARAATPASEPPTAPSPRARAQRFVALALAGGSLIGVGIGTYFGIRAYTQSSSADGHCDASGCDPDGVALRHSSLRAGNAATVSFIAAGALGVAAAVVWITVPSGARPSNGVRVGLGASGLSMEGRF